MNQLLSGAGVAIIGMAGRFPGAGDVDVFWRNLCQGTESIVFFNGAEDAIRPGEEAANYVRARGMLEGADLFDAAFFGMTPQEAVMTDPQHRVFLECAWEALENSGCIPDKFAGAIGVFAGMSMNTYLSYNLATAPALMAQSDNYQLMLSNDKDYLPTRVSYKLNLKGPSLTVQTACSTSLSAVCVACQNLLNFECDAALAGAVSISFPQRTGYFHQPGGVASADGHCRAFDAAASGTVPGEGVGIVVMKRLEEALANGDRIYAVIRGFAMNNDGSSKIGFTAPSIDGQSDVIATALAMAGFPADTIGYVETHGTGTPVGDPIEIEGLTKAFRVTTAKTGFCPIGSVKTNIGHLDAAGGMAGLIKTVLSLYHKRIPPSLHFKEANPRIDFNSSPFFVNSSLREWEATSFPRRAGVSSFGMGGTNTHVVMEEAPPCEMPGRSRPAQLLPLSAKTQAALDRASANLGTRVGGLAADELANVACTLQTARHDFAFRRICVCRDGASAVRGLGATDPQHEFTRVLKQGNPSVTFLFPGQGTQQVNMTRGLYNNESAFRETVDECTGLLESHLGFNLRDVIYPGTAEAEAARLRLTQTEFAQPALFVVEYALARLWMSWGIRPSAFIGHSLGEYVAACLAGVFSLKDALMIVARRGQLMQELQPGKMLAVRGSPSIIDSLPINGVSLASVNSPSLFVLSGPSDAIDEAKAHLDQSGIGCTPLQVSHAFHSEMTDPMLDALRELVGSVERRSPQIPFISNVTGDWITAVDAMDPAYWVRHTRQTVLFGKGVHELVQKSSHVLLEVGHGRVLAGLVRQQTGIHESITVLSALPHNPGETCDVEAVLTTLGQLWLAGVPVDWKRFHQGEKRSLVSLPTYPFERKRHYAEPPDLIAELPALKRTHNGGPSVNVPELLPIIMQTSPGGNGAADVAETSNLRSKLRSLLSELSGFSIADIGERTTFAEMGLDSLFLTQFSLAIEKRLRIRVSFGELLKKYSTIEKLAAHVGSALCLAPDSAHADAAGDGTGRSDATSTLQEHGMLFPLTEAQMEIWYASQMSPEASCAYNESYLVHFHGIIHSEHLRSAWERLIGRHEALRVTFDPEGRHQMAHAMVSTPMQLRDFAAMSGVRCEEAFDAFQMEDARRPFDLVKGPVARATLVRLGEKHHVLVLTFHHIVCDGYSFGQLLAELGELYSSGVLGHEPQLQHAVQLSDFIRLQKASLVEHAERTSEAYWVDQFSDATPVLELPLDFPRSSHWTFRGAREYSSVSAPLTRALRQLGARHNCTLYQTLLAGYAMLLQRLSGQAEIVIGVPMACRAPEGGQSVVGHFVNFLPLRIRAGLDGTFPGYLGEVSSRFVSAFEHQNYTFGTLIRKLNAARVPGRMPLTSATFNFEHHDTPPVFLDLVSTLTTNRHSNTNFDIGFSVIEVNDTLELDCRYNTALFSEATIRGWLVQFHILLENITSNPDGLAGDPGLEPADESGELLEERTRSAGMAGNGAPEHAFTGPHAREPSSANPQDSHGNGRVAGNGGAGDALLTAQKMRRFLETRLPGFMIPSTFVFVDALPLTPNGKVDRKSLPAPEQEVKAVGKAFVAPSNATERTLAEIWAEVLDCGGMSIQDNFFELGGHSLLVMRVISRIRTTFQIELPMHMVFEHPTIESLSQEIEKIVGAEIGGMTDAEVASRAGSPP